MAGVLSRFSLKEKYEIAYHNYVEAKRTYQVQK